MLIFHASWLHAQKPSYKTDPAIENLMRDFMQAIHAKDSTGFRRLFYDGPVAWTGINKEKTHADERRRDSLVVSYFNDNYKSFIRWVARDKRAMEERFYNTVMVSDDAMATVSFDYSFWVDGKKSNWGKESWGLLKIDGKWKIASVLFSMDLETLNPEPATR